MISILKVFLKVRNVYDVTVFEIGIALCSREGLWVQVASGALIAVRDVRF